MTADRDADARAAGLADAPPPARRPLSRAASTSAVLPGSTATMTRVADSPNSVAVVRSTPPSPAAAGIVTSTPMPPVSKQHSASATAKPPSEQSCAERNRVAANQVDEQRLQRPLAREIQRRRHTAHQPVHRLQVFAAAKFAEVVAEQNDVEPRLAETPASHLRRVARSRRRRR